MGVQLLNKTLVMRDTAKVQSRPTLIDDSEMMKTINDEIDSARTVRGQFTTTEVEGQTVEEEET